MFGLGRNWSPFIGARTGWERGAAVKSLHGCHHDCKIKIRIMTDEILKQRENELLAKFKVDQLTARRESLLKKLPEFMSQSTIERVS